MTLNQKIKPNHKIYANRFIHLQTLMFSYFIFHHSHVNDMFRIA